MPYLLPLPTISHPAIGSTPQPNFTRVTVGNLSLWFSYETPIGFQVGDGSKVVRRNDWGTTTGRHLNYLDGGSEAAKSARLGTPGFQTELNAALNTEAVS